MAQLTKNAKGFVEGVVEYLQKGEKSSSVSDRVRKYLKKISEQDVKDSIAQVDSAVTLSDSEKENVERIIQRVTGRPVRAEYRKLPGLLGGIRIKIGELILDTSLRTQLEEMKVSLLT